MLPATVGPQEVEKIEEILKRSALGIGCEVALLLVTKSFKKCYVDSHNPRYVLVEAWSPWPGRILSIADFIAQDDEKEVLGFSMVLVFSVKSLGSKTEWGEFRGFNDPKAACVFFS